MQKSNLKALQLLILPFIFGSILFWSLNQNIYVYFIGQFFGIIFFIQCFILIHEFGHNSLFKTTQLNLIFGKIISFFVFIPFDNWRLIHELHHKWTGWRDRDPTTEKTFINRLSPFQKKIVDFSWKYHIPLFTLGYRFGIYWKIEKLKRFLSKEEFQTCLYSMGRMIFVYSIILFYFSNWFLLLLPSLLISFIFTDIISLSQHSNIEIPNSNGAEVLPIKYQEQAKYSRSLIFSPFISKYILFYFNFHEAHHCYPGLPCYFLPQIKHSSGQSYHFYKWVKKAKSLKGSEFIFTESKNRKDY